MAKRSLPDISERGERHHPLRRVPEFEVLPHGAVRTPKIAGIETGINEYPLERIDVEVADEPLHFLSQIQHGGFHVPRVALLGKSLSGAMP
jgi:hypothetical protein